MRISQYITRFAVLTALAFAASAAASGAIETVHVANWHGKRRLLLYSVSAACAAAAAGGALLWLIIAGNAAHPAFRAVLSAPAFCAAVIRHSEWTCDAALLMDGTMDPVWRRSLRERLSDACRAALSCAVLALVWLFPAGWDGAWASFLSWRAAAVTGIAFLSAVLLSMGSLTSAYSMKLKLDAPSMAFLAAGAGTALLAIPVSGGTDHALLRLAATAPLLLLSARIGSRGYLALRFDAEAGRFGLALAGVAAIALACGIIWRVPLQF